MKKASLLASILVFLSCHISLGQAFQKKADRNDFDPQGGRFFAKISLLNLIHPTSPSLDIGAEWMLTKKISIAAMYGFRTGKLDISQFEDQLYLDQYQKYFGSLRFFLASRQQLGYRNIFDPSFIALDVYASRGQTKEKDNFALSQGQDSRLYYIEASLEKEVWGLGLKLGFLERITNFLEIEWALGLGYLSYQRRYTEIINPIIEPSSYTEEYLWPYDDRRIGRSDFINFIIQLQFNFMIF